MSVFEHLLITITSIKKITDSNVDLPVITNKEVLEKVKQDGHFGAANWLHQIAPDPKPTSATYQLTPVPHLN